MKCWGSSWSIQFFILAVFVATFCCGKVECQPTMSSIISYSAAMLRELRPQCLSSCEHTQHTFPQQPGRKRGRKGGVKQRSRRRKAKQFLPTFVFGNIRSIGNKLDELSACSKHLYEYREASFLGFVETWLNDRTPDSAINIDGFSVLRGDRTEASKKSRGGGVCLYVNERWANKNNVTVYEKICTPHIELLSVNVRPYYLPREFTSVVINIVYIPETNLGPEAIELLTSRINDQETRSPDAIKLIVGDFNHCLLDTALPHYHQHVTCTTRGTTTLDLCYSNIPDAYKSIPLPPLGASDHNNVYLIPKYRPVLKTKKPTTRVVEECLPIKKEEMLKMLC
ncbi:hypothetical protein EGW08_003103 [Elysia chlorotica]|uniref:Endonuclease/exonuclease/phosphatase domain-containing protein n=1 Tax=Elysia chlorotica TaxID=188477 RepID=A0A3S0ZXJ5_ELYCH|nr:hypothetical protein EGW08_003103 [Elysia chlorotica]